jgi:hypothetical protein
MTSQRERVIKVTNLDSKISGTSSYSPEFYSRANSSFSDLGNSDFKHDLTAQHCSLQSQEQ